MSRTLRRSLLAAAGLAAIGAAAVFGVVLMLRATEPASAPSARCSAGGYQLDTEQAANAALVVGTTVRRDLPARAGTIGIATALQEAWLRNIDWGDRDSVGMFQQRPSQGWGTVEQIMDPVYATNIFYDHLVKVPGYTELPVTEAAQAVQRSGFPDAYAKHEPLAREFASALTGWSEASLTCSLGADEGDAALVPELVLVRTERDYGVAGTLGQWPENDDAESAAPAAIFDVAALGRPSSDAPRLAWAVGQGAVAAAAETGAGRVWVADWVWERESGAWRELAEGEAGAGPGVVVVTPSP